MLKNGFNLAIILLLVLGLFFSFLNFGNTAGDYALYFLDVGQGESELINSGAFNILVDAGYTNQIVSALDKILKGRYLDLGIISEVQADYTNGYNFLLRSYDLGAILWNGREDGNSPEWQSFIAETRSRNIPMIPISEGDMIHIGDTKIKTISPNSSFLRSGEVADTSLVFHVSAPGMNALLTGGVGNNVESVLSKSNLSQTDILKVSYRGSKNSSSEPFLNSLKPKISVIASGPKIQPNPDVLSRLKTTGSLVFQTGLSGTIKIFPKNGKLRVFTEK